MEKVAGHFSHASSHSENVASARRVRRGWSFIICKGGPAILPGGHFQNLDLFWRGSFLVGSVTYLAGHFTAIFTNMQISEVPKPTDDCVFSCRQSS